VRPATIDPSQSAPKLLEYRFLIKEFYSGSGMMRVRHSIAILAAFLAVQEGPAFAQRLTKNTEHMVDASIRKLLRQMDKDKNGTISKDEFLRYFSERFDRLDVNRDRRLVSDELRPMLIPNAKEKYSPPKVF
jgi:hypothetical protein